MGCGVEFVFFFEELFPASVECENCGRGGVGGRGWEAGEFVGVPVWSRRKELVRFSTYFKNIIMKGGCSLVCP